MTEHLMKVVYGIIFFINELNENKNVNVTIRQRIIENSIFDCFTFMTIHSKPVSFLDFENDMKCFENAKVDFTDDI